MRLTLNNLTSILSTASDNSLGSIGLTTEKNQPKSGEANFTFCFVEPDTNTRVKVDSFHWYVRILITKRSKLITNYVFASNYSELRYKNKLTHIYHFFVPSPSPIPNTSFIGQFSI